VAKGVKCSAAANLLAETLPQDRVRKSNPSNWQCQMLKETATYGEGFVNKNRSLLVKASTFIPGGTKRKGNQI